MKHLLIALFSVGCVHSGQVETVVEYPLSSVTGSPCTDGLILNLAARCDSVSTEQVNPYVWEFTCVDPLEETEDDILYRPYTQSAFVIIDRKFPVELIPMYVGYLCEDNSTMGGFMEPGMEFVPMYPNPDRMPQ